jgi:hypothetical protein
MRKLIDIITESATDLKPGQLFIPGLPGRIIAASGPFVLLHDVDDYGDSKKNEYDVYRKQGGAWKHMENLNLPYQNQRRAVDMFREEYGHDENRE